MNGKIPLEAFDYYFAMGRERSYQRVADHFGVSKRAVTKRAGKENWQSRVLELERKVRDRGEQRAVETLDAINARHLRTLKVITGKALSTLQSKDLSRAMEAVRAIEMAIRLERAICDGPDAAQADRTEDLLRERFERWVCGDDEGEEDNGA